MTQYADAVDYFSVENKHLKFGYPLKDFLSRSTLVSRTRDNKESEFAALSSYELVTGFVPEVVDPLTPDEYMENFGAKEPVRDVMAQFKKMGSEYTGNAILTLSKSFPWSTAVIERSLREILEGNLSRWTSRWASIDWVRSQGSPPYATANRCERSAADVAVCAVLVAHHMELEAPETLDEDDGTAAFGVVYADFCSIVRTPWANALNKKKGSIVAGIMLANLPKVSQPK